MFRFAELLVILGIVYLIANIIHYIYNKGSGPDGKAMFSLSNSWLGSDKKKKDEEAAKDSDSRSKKR